MAYWGLWPIYTHSHRVFLITESDPQMQQPIQPTRMCISQLTLPYRVPCDIDLGFWRFVAAVVGGCFLASPKNSSMASSNPKSHKISRDLCYVRLRGWMFCHPSCRIFGEVFCSCLEHVSNQRCKYTDTIVYMFDHSHASVKSFWRSSIWDAKKSIKERPRNPSPPANAMTAPNVLESWPDGCSGGIWNWLKDIEA